MSQETPPSFGAPVPPVEPPAYFGPPPPPPPPPGRRRFGLRHPRIGIAVLAALVAAGGAGGFLISQAAVSTSLVSSPESGASPSPSPSGGPFHGRGGFGGFAGVNLLQDAATYLAISEQTLEADLQGGKSLAQVAGTVTGKSSSGLISALVSDETTAINSAESSGKINSTQSSKLKSNLTGQITSFVNRTGHQPSTVPSAGLPASGEQAAIAAAAKAIGVTASELESDLAGGQSIASVAGAHGVSVSTVESDVTSAVDTQISSLESSGKLTSTEASQLTSQVPTRVDAWVNDTYPGWPFGPFGSLGGGFLGGPFGGFGPGGPWGHGPNASPSASPSSS
ncbi:MAG: hypothetical protein WCB85_08355 [Candidatus Dormiibacterota bacterium]